MSGHTPGPWIVTRQIGIAHGISAAKDYTGHPHTFATVAKAYSPGNADLIAAAPELLEALREYIAEFNHNAPDDCYSTGPKTGDIIQDHVICPGCVARKRATAAIAKSTGAK